MVLIAILIYMFRHMLKATLFLLPLLGITWIIGIFAVNEDTVVFAWIFAILNSFQVTTVYIYQATVNYHNTIF